MCSGLEIGIYRGRYLEEMSLTWTWIFGFVKCFLKCDYSDCFFKERKKDTLFLQSHYHRSTVHIFLSILFFKNIFRNSKKCFLSWKIINSQFFLSLTILINYYYYACNSDLENALIYLIYHFRNNTFKLSPDVIISFLNFRICFQGNRSKIYIYNNITDICCFLLTLCKTLPDGLLFQIDCKKCFFTFYIDLFLVCPSFPQIMLLGHWIRLQAVPF